MLNFKQVELSDKKEIELCLRLNTYPACDFSFTNMYAWNAKFHTEYAIKSKTLFLRFTDSDGLLYYMMPIGEMKIPEAFKCIKENAASMGIPFRMKTITHQMWEIIEKYMPGEFEYIHERDNDEYIYLTEKLITLQGKKLQSKRNHINRFKRENKDWEYFPLISQQDIEQCIAMLEEWGEGKEENSSCYDYIATERMLSNFHFLELKGGAIRVNGKIIAFTIGEKLTDDTFVVHVEKAFGDINGAYTMINQQFAEHEASSFKYINREEDMGLEQLRKAKLSYQPDILLQEGILLPKN